MKQGQLTLFIIVGIVLLSVFIFLFFLVGSLSEKKLEEQRTQVVHTALESASVQYYVSVCVENALKDGLKLLGQQGGYIFQGQPGGLFTPDTRPFDAGDVALGIVPSARTVPPLFPCPEGFIEKEPAYCRYPYHDGVVRFGDDKLPSLDGGIFSIRSQLERYIGSAVKDCVDIPSLVRESGLSGYHVEAGEPAALIDFGATRVTAKVNYPLFVRIGDEGPTTQYINFEAQVPVRFRRLYEAIKDIVQKDTVYVDFNMSSDPFKETFDGQLVKLSLLSPTITFEPFILGRDDVFVFNDSASLIENQSYIFRLARKNRPPALDYISKNPSVQDVYDYLVLEGEAFEFIPRAIDPDEDEITFTSSGDLGDTFGPEVQYSPRPPANYKQRVTATDSDQSDWQDVRVLVEPTLTPAFTVSTLYADIPAGVVSPEDPFFLDARASNTTLDPFADYTFQWHAMVASLPPGVDYACVLFPGYGRCEDTLPAITSIRQQNPWTPAGSFGIQLDVNLAYNGREQQASSAQQVTLVPCLPHRNPDDAAPYPNSQDDNPYLADHACCVGDPSAEPGSWRLAEKNEITCYTNPAAEQSCEGGLVLLRRSKSIGCDGVRGNTCIELSDQSNAQLGDWIPTQTCGFNSPGLACSGIAVDCEGLSPYGLRPGQGWCYGNQGCGSFCPEGSPIVDINGNGVADAQDTCGCAGNDEKACDEDADNTFGGECRSTFGFSHCTDRPG